MHAVQHECEMDAALFAHAFPAEVHNDPYPILSYAVHAHFFSVIPSADADPPSHQVRAGGRARAVWVAAVGESLSAAATRPLPHADPAELESCSDDALQLYQKAITLMSGDEAADPHRRALSIAFAPYLTAWVRLTQARKVEMARAVVKADSRDMTKSPVIRPWVVRHAQPAA